MIGRGIVIDTEGSGLFDFKRDADAEGQPRMAQLSMIAIDENGDVENDYNFYIKPDGWSMSPEATAVNGLTDEFLHANGVPILTALHAYTMAIQSGRFVIAHNAQHDMKQIRGELRRAGLDDLFEIARNVCTMRKANGIILKPGGKKGWPSLDRCREVLGIPLEGSHRGMKDAADALSVYRHLRAQGVDLLPEVHHHAHVEEIRANG